MKTAKELELSLLLKESHIQQLNLKLNDLQNRIDKAIKYVENNEYYTKLRKKFIDKLLQILKGEDDEI